MVGPDPLRFPRTLLDQIVEHAREDMPNECCGIVAAKDGAAVHVYRARNVHESPTRFEIDGLEVMRIQNEIDERGWTLASLYHSHTKTAAYPSQTDVNFAANWPGVEWIIVGIAAGSDPTVRSYLIDDGAITEVALDRD